MLPMIRRRKHAATQGGFDGGSGAVPWYLSGGISASDVGAVWSPEGAESLAASYLRIAGDLGNANLDPAVVGAGVAPTWDAVNGWKSDGTKHLWTGITPPTDHTYTYKIKFSGISGTGRTLIGSYKTGAALFQINPNHGGVTVIFQDVTSIQHGPNMTSGILTISGKSFYRNGLINYTIAPADSTYEDIALFGRNDDGTINAATLITGNIQKVAVYKRELTYLENEAVDKAMGAAGEPGFWTRNTAVLQASETGETCCEEPTVIYEGSPQVLVGETNVFKMWYTGTPSGNIWYAESTDGISWTKRSTAVLAGVYHSCVVKVGTTYYLYGVTQAAQTVGNVYTSSDGISWSSAATNIINNGNTLGNFWVWQEAEGDWRMLFEDRVTTWRGNYATSVDGLSWTVQNANVIAASIGWVWKNPADSKYWLWTHKQPYGVTVSNGARYYSTDLVTWTQSPAGNTLPRYNPTYETRQLADLTLLEKDGRVYCWHTSTPDGSTLFYVSEAHVDMTLAALVATSEGVT